MKKAIKKALLIVLIYSIGLGCLLILSNRVQQIDNLETQQQVEYK